MAYLTAPLRSDRIARVGRPILVLVALLLSPACGGSGGGAGTGAPAPSGVARGSGSSSAGSGSSTGAAPGAVAAAPIEEVIARRFAPQLRYNAYHDDGDRSLQNRNEDFFPGSVDRFFDALSSGWVPIVTQMSIVHSPAVVETLPLGGQASFTNDSLEGYPERMAGSPPGQAPNYVNVYEASSRRIQRPDGTQERTYFAEFWQWYPYDSACSRALSVIGCFGGHRADWEHTTYEIGATIAPNGSVRNMAIVAAFFYGHERNVRVPATVLETVDDNGSPGGDHPIVYVSMGKHAAYPQAGEFHDFAGAGLASDLDDFFRGNGVWIDTWRAAQIDISRRAYLDDPLAFAPASFLQIVAGSRSVSFPTWLDFPGRWGPDIIGYSSTFGSAAWVRSALGPWAEPAFTDLGGNASPYGAWKAAQPSLEVYADRGLSIPRARPVPIPRVR